MPTKECRDCKSVVSISAETCPVCGAKYPAYNTGKICFHRIKYFQGCAIPMKVYIDGTLKAELKNDQSTDEFEINGDTHDIEIILKNAFGGTYRKSISIKVMPGTYYYVDFDCNGKGKEVIQTSIYEKPLFM